MIPISYISPNNSLDSTGRPIHTPPPPSKSPGPYTGTSALRHAVPVANHYQKHINQQHSHQHSHQHSQNM